MPIRLTDSQLDAVISAARPLAVERRDAFLQAVAGALAAVPAWCTVSAPRPRAGSSTRRI